MVLVIGVVVLFFRDVDEVFKFFEKGCLDSVVYFWRFNIFVVDKMFCIFVNFFFCV